MDKQKFYQILDRLLERTKEGKLEWESTVNNDTFLVALEDAAISITKLNNYYSFDFMDAIGHTVDKELISDRDFSIDSFSEFEGDPENPYEKTKRIFDLARNQSLKPEQTVDRILEQLAA